MALDEAIFENATVPTLRVYSWDHPALSFGYFGKYADAETLGPQRDVVRRWTGGGIVLHGEDLTYSLAIPAQAGVSLSNTRAIYAGVHAALRDALISRGHAAELASTDSPRISEACFERPVTADLMQNQRKIAGAAQRRTRGGLLQQGSVQIGAVSDDLTLDFAQRLCNTLKHFDVTPDLANRAEEIAAAKYSNPEWLRRR
jgi:lipoate-protein ligase A